MSITTDALIKQYQDAYAAAKEKDDTTGMNAAHINAEAIRASQGYSGGVDGSQYISTGLKSANAQNDYINQLYAAKQASALSGLKSAYEQNTADLNNTAAQIPATYNTARNATASTSAINQAGFNERAASSGLNNGAGGQASLSMANTLQSNLSSLDTAQAFKLADIDTQRAKLAAAYNNQIQQAIADNDNTRAQALYAEATRVDNSLVATSQAQAQLNYQQQQAQTSQSQYSDANAQASAQAYAKATGSYELYKKAFGWSDEQVAAANAKYIADNTPTAKSYSGSSSKSSSGSSNTSGYTDNSVATLSDTDAGYQVGMNRTSTGQLATVQRLYSEGQITESQANVLIQKFNLS